MKYPTLVLTLTILTSSLLSQEHEFDHRGFRGYTAKHLIFPLKSIVPRAQIEGKKISEAYRYTESSGWTFFDLVALHYESGWLIHWRLDTRSAKIGTMFLSEFDPDVQKQIMTWIDLARSDETWDGEKVLGNPGGFDDGFRAIIAQFANDELNHRVFHASQPSKPDGAFGSFVELSQRISEVLTVTIRN